MQLLYRAHMLPLLGRQISEENPRDFAKMTRNTNRMSQVLVLVLAGATLCVALAVSDELLEIQKKLSGPSLTVDQIEFWVEKSHKLLSQMDDSERQQLNYRAPMLEDLYQIMTDRHCTKERFDFRTGIQDELGQDEKSSLWEFVRTHNAKLMDYCSRNLAKDLANIYARVQGNEMRAQVDQLMSIAHRLAPNEDFTKEILPFDILASALKEYLESGGVHLDNPKGRRMTAHLAELTGRLNQVLLASCDKLINYLDELVPQYHELEALAGSIEASIQWPDESASVLERINVCQFVKQRASDLFLFNNYDYQQLNGMLFSQTGAPSMELHDVPEMIDVMSHILESRMDLFGENHQQAIDDLDELDSLRNINPDRCHEPYFRRIQAMVAKNRQYTNIMAYLNKQIANQVAMCSEPFQAEVKERVEGLFNDDITNIDEVAHDAMVMAKASGKTQTELEADIPADVISDLLSVHPETKELIAEPCHEVLESVDDLLDLYKMMIHLEKPHGSHFNQETRQWMLRGEVCAAI